MAGNTGQGSSTGSSGGQNRNENERFHYDKQSRQITIPSISESRSLSLDQFFSELRRAGLDDKEMKRVWESSTGSGSGSQTEQR